MLNYDFNRNVIMLVKSFLTIVCCAVNILARFQIIALLLVDLPRIPN